MKTLIYTTSVNTDGRAIKDTNLCDITRKSWEHYCKRHGIDFYVIDEPQHPNTSPHWFRYWIFDLKPGYDRYLYIDTDIMVKWNAPNIFDEFSKGKIRAVRDNSGLSWIWEGIKSYQSMFEGVDLQWDTYFNSGVLLFDKEHKHIIETFKDFYIDNQLIIEQYRDKYRKGFDQTVFNYFLKYIQEDVELVSEKWNLFHMVRREILQNGYFIDMGYFWHFNGLPRQNQIQIVNSIWEQIKNNYDK